MNKEFFSLIYFGLAAIFTIWFLRRSMGDARKPHQLHMDSPDSAPRVLPPEEKVPNAPAAKVKNLTYYFNYNGHSWEAYEVLGLPPGSSVEAVEQAYKDALLASDPQSSEFLTTAYETIKRGRT